MISNYKEYCEKIKLARTELLNNIDELIRKIFKIRNEKSFKEGGIIDTYYPTKNISIEDFVNKCVAKFEKEIENKEIKRAAKDFNL